MSYADHVRTTQRPQCWGNEHNYDPDGDEECAGCRFQHSCRAEINREGSPAVTGYRPAYRRPQQAQAPARRHDEDSDVRSNFDEDIVPEGERPLERFVKDAAGGAMRGMFFEMYQFWKRYRIP